MHHFASRASFGRAKNIQYDVIYTTFNIYLPIQYDGLDLNWRLEDRLEEEMHGD